jgi:predicted dehydrogenase
VEGLRVQPLPVEDTARLFVRSAAGVMGSVDLSWSINKELDWYVKIYGSRGTINIGWAQSRIKRAGAEWEVFGSGYDKVQAFTAQVANVARAVRGEEALLITADDAIASVEVIEAAYRSMRAAPWTGVQAGEALTQTPPSVTMTDVIREVARG